MAIKMDGNTITELHLKASDGSAVTKHLTEDGTIPMPTETLDISSNGQHDVTNYAKVNVSVEGGGGTPGEFVPLKTVTQSEAARECPFVWESDWEQYDVFYIICNATLSSSDYLYFGFSTNTQQSVYCNSSQTALFNGFEDFSVFAPVNNRKNNTLVGGAFATSRAIGGYSPGGTAMFYTYNASTSIQPDSTFQIFGAKLPV